MSILTTNYSRHSVGIDEYIKVHHKSPDQYANYRRMWDQNMVAGGGSNLLFLLLESTSKCNLKCPMCSHYDGYPQTADMNEEIFKKALKGIKDMQIPSVCMNLTNEPLLDKGIFDKIKAVSDIDSVFDIHMNTNATLLDEKAATKLLSSGLTRLLIGFDGFSKETYESVRNKAKYEIVLNNILNFIKLKEESKKVFPVVRLSFVKTSMNENEIEQWVDFWKDKVDYLIIQEYLSTVADNSKDYLKPQNSLRKGISKDNIFCNQPFERLAIRGNGDVLPCCSHLMAGNGGAVGNLLYNSLDEIWNNDKTQSIRNAFLNSTWDNHPICSKCLSTTYKLE